MISARRPWAWIFIPAVLLAALQIQWVHALSWDEVEFFRATRWIAQGQLPYRDYWEHHTPLQWFLFAPFAALADGPGVSSVVLMRWIQAPLWLAILGFVYLLARRSGATPTRTAIAPLLLAGSPNLLANLIEYRVDVLGNFAYLGAVMIAVSAPRATRAWIAYGALMSAAVLANMRLAPLVITTSVVLIFFRSDEQRWGWNGRALWMATGVAVVAAAFAAYLFVSGSAAPFEMSMRSNLLFDRLQETDTFLPAFLTPFRSFDAAAVALWIGGGAGCALAVRAMRRPSIPQLLAVLALISFIAVTRLSVNYFYHFVTTLILLAPLAAMVIPEGRGTHLAMAGVAVVLLVGIVFAARSPFGAAMDGQNIVMTQADRRTAPNERVFDGCGFALRRRPAYRYWFLPGVVRIMAANGLVEPYDGRRMRADPPAAIIYNYRVRLWFEHFPDTAIYALHHYVPLYRNLWVPGLSGVVVPGRTVRWTVPRDGRYRVYASELLIKHPWFSRPLDYADVSGRDAARYEIPLPELPLVDPAGYSITVDDFATRSTTLELRKGSVVEFTSQLPRRTGVMIVPADLTSACITPPAPFL